MINLVVNACDAMEGEGQVDVTLTAAAGRTRAASGPGPGAVLTIADNGPGMPPEVLARCLEPFFTTKRRGQGSGLGLSTVYGLVTERGGHMDIDSDRDRHHGPDLAAALRRRSGERQERKARSWPPGQTITGRILLVEDEPDLRLMAPAVPGEHRPRRAWWRSRPSSPCPPATRRPPSTPWSPTSCCPGMSGVELADAVQQGPSGDAGVVHDRLRRVADGAAACRRPGANLLRKPYRPDALRLRVADMLGKRALQGSKR